MARKKQLQERRVVLYNRKTNSYEEVNEWSAKLKLKHDHISNEGRYCTIPEVPKYVATPPPPPKAQPEKAAEEATN